MKTKSGRPEKIIVMRKDGYHIMVENENGDVEFVELGELVTIRQARDKAREMGHEVFHWVREDTGSRIEKFMF